MIFINKAKILSKARRQTWVKMPEPSATKTGVFKHRGVVKHRKILMNTGRNVQDRESLQWDDLTYFAY